MATTSAMTPERRARVEELVRDHGMTRAEADLAESIEAGEVDGDVIVIGSPDEGTVDELRAAVVDPAPATLAETFPVTGTRTVDIDVLEGWSFTETSDDERAQVTIRKAGPTGEHIVTVPLNPGQAAGIDYVPGLDVGGTIHVQVLGAVEGSVHGRGLD
jgi:hypothetical protein